MAKCCKCGLKILPSSLWSLRLGKVTNNPFWRREIVGQEWNAKNIEYVFHSLVQVFKQQGMKKNRKIILVWKLMRELKGTFIPLISLKNSFFLSSQNKVELEGTLIQFHSFHYLYSFHSIPFIYNFLFKMVNKHFCSLQHHNPTDMKSMVHKYFSSLYLTCTVYNGIEWNRMSKL